MPPDAVATGSLMLMAPAGWAIERAIAAVPLSRIAARRAIAPRRLADNADGRQAPASELGLTRIFRPHSLALRPAYARRIAVTSEHNGSDARIVSIRVTLPWLSCCPQPRAAYMCAHAKRQAQLRLLQLRQSRVQHKPIAYRSDGNA